MIDILLDENDDLLFRDGDFALGDPLMQDVGAILRLNQGDLKGDPILGPNLTQLIGSKSTRQELQQRVRLHLARDGKSDAEINRLELGKRT